MSSTFYLDSKRQHGLNPDGLTFALYHFPSGVAEVVDDFSDNDRDLTLTGYAGTYGGQASGYVGRALDFNGTSQYATIGGAAFPRASLQSGTVQAQVYLPTWRPSGTVVDLGGNIRLSYNNASGAFEAFLADGAGASGYLYTTSSGHIGDWNYLALQWSSGSATSYGSGLCKLYFDGEVEYTFSGAVPHPNVVNTSRIGARTNATDFLYTNARVDELAIDTFKTDNEIRNHYLREKELYTLSVSRGATHIADSFIAKIWNPDAKKAGKYSQFDNVDIQSRDNKIFTGRIENVTADKSLGDILILEGRDFRAELTDRYALESYASGTDTSAIVSDILNKYSRNIPNRAISTTGHVLQGTRTFAGQSAAYVIYTLAREDNYAAHTHIHDDGTYEFHYAAANATDSGYSLLEGSDYIIKVKKIDSGFDTINKSTVVGATVGGSALISSVDNFDSQTLLGLTKEFFKVDQSLATQGDVDKAAQSYADQQSEVQYIELEVLLTTPNATIEKLGTGELVTLNIPTHKIENEKFLVLDKVIDFPEGIVTMKLANYRKEIEDYLFQLIAAQKQKESEDLNVQTLPKIINVSEDIKIRELGIKVYDRDLGTSFVVGEQDIGLGKVGRVKANKQWTERFDFEQNDLQTNIDLDNPQGAVRISSTSGGSSSKEFTSQSDFETSVVQRNIDTTIVVGSMQISTASGDARWDGSVFDSSATDTTWDTLAFTKQFTPTSGDVGWEFRASNTLFAAGDGTPSWSIIGSGATPITLTDTGRYGQVRSILFASGSAGVPDSNTIGLFHLNEGTGTNADDVSSTANDGTLAAGATWTTTNKFGGYAVNFDNTANAYINLPDHANYDVTSDYTWEAWIYRPSSAGFDNIIGRDDLASNRLWLFAVNGNDKLEYFGSHGGSLNINFAAANALPGNTWTHVAVVYDSAADTVSIYMGGNREAQATGVTSNLTAGNNAIQIGAQGNGSNNFNGNIDEVRLSKSVRYTGATYTVPTTAFAPMQNMTPRVDDITMNYTTSVGLSASGVLILPVWDTQLSSGQFDWVSWDRTNNSAFLSLAVRSSGSNYIGNWLALPTGTVSNGIVNYDLRDNNIWGSSLQWKADLFRSGTSNNPRLNSVNMSFSSGSTQPTIGESGGAWSLIYSA